MRYVLPPILLVVVLCLLLPALISVATLQSPSLNSPSAVCLAHISTVPCVLSSMVCALASFSQPSPVSLCML